MKNYLSSLHLHIGKGEFWALISALAYAMDNIFTSSAVRGQGLNSFLGVSLRATPVLIFSLIMSLFVNRRNKNSVSPFSDWKLLLALVGNGLLTFVIGNTLLLAAFRTGGVLITSPVLGTNVLWGAILAAVFLKERINKGMIIGILISIAGVVMLTLSKSNTTQLTQNWWQAIPFAMTTAFSWALAGVFITFAMRKGVDRFLALAIALFTGLVVLNGYLFFTGQINLYVTTPPHLIRNVLIAGLFNTVALVSVTTAMSLTSVASAQTINSLQVGLAPILAWLFLSERMNLLLSISIVLILVGVVIVQQKRAKFQTPPNVRTSQIEVDT